MDLPNTDYTDQYIFFCQQAGLPINEVPEDGKMGLQYEIAMKEIAPHLYQNLTRPKAKSLKADVRDRYQRGVMWTSDLEEYEKKGFSGTASNIRKEMESARQILMEKEIAEMKARNDKHAEEMLNKPKGMRFTKPLPQEQVMHARKQIGITGLAEWQK